MRRMISIQLQEHDHTTTDRSNNDEGIADQGEETGKETRKKWTQSRRKYKQKK